MAWLDEIGEAVQRANASERQSVADRQMRQHTLDAEFQENRNHLAHIVAPVLIEAAEKITSMGKAARVIAPGGMSAALGNTARYGLVVQGQRAEKALEFSANRVSKSIQVRKPGGAEYFTRSDLTAETIQETVVDFVKDALTGR